MHARVISGRLHRNCSRSVEHHWSTTALELFSAIALPLECDPFKPHYTSANNKSKAIQQKPLWNCTETAHWNTRGANQWDHKPLALDTAFFGEFLRNIATMRPANSKPTLEMNNCTSSVTLKKCFQLLICVHCLLWPVLTFIWLRPKWRTNIASWINSDVDCICINFRICS